MTQAEVRRTFLEHDLMKLTKLLCGALCALSLVTTASAVELVVDGGFEAGTPNPFWTESSTNFGTPLCDLATCGTGTGTGPASGNFWVWFGGISASEQGLVSQPITFPIGTATLSFAFENIVSDSSDDFVEARIDGTPVWTYTGGGIYSGLLGYSPISVNIDQYADGGTYTLEFFSETFAVNGGGSNFFIDDVSIDAIPVPEPTSLVSLFGVAAVMVLRRRIG